MSREIGCLLFLQLHLNSTLLNHPIIQSTMAHLTRLSLRIGRSILPITSAPLLTTHLRQQPNRYSRRQSPSTITNPHRTYHSAFHPRLPEHEYTNSQTAILTASLPHIPTHGFTAKALTLGARDAGFLDVSVQLLPRGEFDLILFWLASRRGLLRGRVEEGGLFAGNGAGKNRAEMSTEQKVRLLILERLRMNEVVRGVWEDVSFPNSFFFLYPSSSLYVRIYYMCIR